MLSNRKVSFIVFQMIVFWDLVPLSFVCSHKRFLLLYSYQFMMKEGYGVAQLVKVLRYKPEGHEFYSRQSHWNFSVT
jgi:hypothetical protein